MKNNFFYRIFQIYELCLWFYKTIKLKNNNKNFFKGNYFFCEIVSSTITVKVNCLLSLALMSKDYDIYVVFQKKSLFYELFYRCVGVKNFIYIDNLKKKNINKFTYKILKKLNKKKAFINFKYKSIDVGRFIASKVLRDEKKGNFDINDYDEKLIDDCVDNSISTILNFEKILTTIPCKGIFFNERGYSPAGEIFELALKKKIKCIQWFGSPLENHHSFKSYNWSNRKFHPLSLEKDSFRMLLKSSKCRSFQKYLMEHLKEQYTKGKWFNRQKLQESKIIMDKNYLKDYLKIKNKKKICVIFTHVFNDATFFYGKSIFSSYEEWLREILKKIKNNDDFNWIIKIHPANLLRSQVSLEENLINSLFRKLPDNVKVLKPNSPINTYSFFRSCDIAFTVRGTIGCEMASFGIPVITAGTGRYSNNGFTLDLKNKSDFHKIFRKLKRIKMLDENQIKLARIYTYGSLIARSIKMDGIKIIYNKKFFFGQEKTDLGSLPKDYESFLSTKEIRLFLQWEKDSFKHDLMDFDNVR